MIRTWRNSGTRKVWEGEHPNQFRGLDFEAAIDLLQGRNGLVAEAGIGILHQAGEIGFADTSAEEGQHHPCGERRVIEPGKRGEIELGPAFGQEQTAVTGKPRQQDLIKGQRWLAASGAEIAQKPMTF